MELVQQLRSFARMAERREAVLIVRAADEIERLRACKRRALAIADERAKESVALKAEIERLRAENANLRRWKALDKPITAAMEIANSHMARLRAENEKTWRNLAYSENDRGRLRAALERIEKTLQPADSAENVETVGRAREIVLATLNGSPEQREP